MTADIQLIDHTRTGRGSRVHVRDQLRRLEREDASTCVVRER